MNIEIKRHSLGHILAQAVKELYPSVKLGIGPATEHGFYYDFDFGGVEFSDSELKNLEKKMKKIISQNQIFQQASIGIEEAIARFKEDGDMYKLELAEKLKAEGETKLSFYKNISQQGEQKFIDMCKGPHVEKMSQLDANSFKLAKVAGAYWLGNADNKQLTRIYAYAYDNKAELDSYLKMLEEAKKRDHRVLGKKLDLFCFSDLVGPGLPMFTPAGTVIREELQKHIENVCRKYGFQKVITPHLSKIDLFETSGHAQKFSEELFHVKSGHGHDFVLKPVQCPHQTQVYASNPRSYKDLPIRYMESEKQYRAEQSGEVGGLSRVYAITVEDGHSFCTVDQIKEEIVNIINIIKDFYTALGLWDKVWVSLSVRDYANLDKYIGEESDWDKAEKMLEEIGEELGLNAKRCEGEAALYGPKLDFMFKDAIGKEIQIPTVQLDFATPQRFKLTYKDNNGEDSVPVMIHRAILGSYERFMMLLIEHFAGVFPLWLAPRQVRIVPVTDKFFDYAKKVEAELYEAGIRVTGDYSSDGLNKKVRNAEKMHNNYILVIGEQEEKDGSVSVRNYKTKEQTVESLQDFKARALDEIKNKSL